MSEREREDCFGVFLDVLLYGKGGAMVGVDHRIMWSDCFVFFLNFFHSSFFCLFLLLFFVFSFFPFFFFQQCLSWRQ